MSKKSCRSIIVGPYLRFLALFRFDTGDLSIESVEVAGKSVVVRDAN